MNERRNEPVNERSLDLESTLAGLPAPWSEPVLPTIRARLAERPQTVVVVDDDPTGTQTVHDVPVLADWTADALGAELLNDVPVFYVLTNSRSLPADRAASLSFVPQRGGITPRSLLDSGDLELPPTGGGLIVAGSYVPTSTAQLAALRQDGAVHTVELDVTTILDPVRALAALKRAHGQVEQSLAAGHDTLLMTSRELVGGADAQHGLAIGNQVSAALVRIVGRLATRPRYIIAKGGITSNDIATRALGFRRALVQGQLAPGIPVWRLGEESAYPGLAYIVFPGNVGEPHTLAQLVRQLRVGAPAEG